MKPRNFLICSSVLLVFLALCQGFDPGVLKAAKVDGVEADPGPRKTSIFTDRIEALNPATLHVTVDHGKVAGCVMGNPGPGAGKQVVIQLANRKITVPLDERRCFSWMHEVKEPQSAKVTIGELSRILFLEPASEKEPSVFFVVDRNVYRPGHELKFAAFLRAPGRESLFEPRVEHRVEVEITSKSKKTVAARLALVSDEFGRIEGQYRFHNEDVLDDYTLSIKGYRGEALVKLAEFRKSKVKLQIDSKMEPGGIRLTFRALDFLNKPVSGSTVRFTAQVVKDISDTVSSDEPDPKKFAYHPIRMKSSPTNWFEREPGEEEKLLLQAGVPFPPLALPFSTALATTNQDLPLKDGKAEHFLTLQNEWLSQKLVVEVQGVLVDVNGREQRASKRIPIHQGHIKTSGDPSIAILLPKRHFSPGESIIAHVKNARPERTSISVMSLLPLRSSPSYYHHDFNPVNPGAWNGRQLNNIYNPHLQNQLFGYRGRLSARISSGPPWGWTSGSTGMIDRRMVTTAPLSENGSTEFRLDKPGAYKLLAITRTTDGREKRVETGFVITDARSGPALILDSATDKLYQPGEHIEAILHSRFDNARVFVVLRDSEGIRDWFPLQVARGISEIRVPVPNDAHYGCQLRVQYQDSGGVMHSADALVHVDQRHRVIRISSEVPETVRPGEEVELAFQVNRKKPTDLVVSVYDQSLLGVAPDRAVKPADFFLADNRIAHQRGDLQLEEVLGGHTPASLAEEIDELLRTRWKNPEEGQPSPELRAARNLATQMKNALSSRYLNTQSLLAWLRLKGVRCITPADYTYYYGDWHVNWETKEQKTLRLIEIIRKPDQNKRTLHVCKRGPFLMLYITHPDQNTYHPYNQLSLLSNHGGWRGSQRFAARADAHYSFNMAASANAFHSFAPSGQSFISHMPLPMEGALELGDDTGALTVRRDFSDSAYFNATVRTDKNGLAKARFKLPDSLTNWRVVVTAVTPDLKVGTHLTQFKTYKPVMVWPMLSRSFTAGDEVDIYASVHNRTDEPQTTQVEINVENGAVLDELSRTVVIPANSHRPVYWRFRPAHPGFTEILMSASCKAGGDASLKRLPVMDCSAEQQITASGFADGAITINVPREADLEKARLEIRLAPSLAADMADTLDYLVAYPHGCVEQTMSRFLPTIKVAQILRKHNIEKPGLEKKIPEYVAAGIKRLLQLQRPDGGWGWQGNGATHEMMTPYALYGLMEAEKAGYEIGKEDAISKGMQRLKQFIDGMNENQAADRIYCMYVYSHRNKVESEWWAWIKEMANGKTVGGKKEKLFLSDYATALALEMAVKGEQKSLATQLARSLAGKAQSEGASLYWKTAKFSRWGDNQFEVTAAVMKALVAYDRSDSRIPGILHFFASTKNGNRWNSTKDTAMILYALCDYLQTTEAHNEDRDVAKTIFSINGGAPKTVAFPDGLTKTISIDGTQLLHGKNRIEFESTGMNRRKGIVISPILYRATFRYWKTGTDVAPLENGLVVTRTFELLDEKGQVKRTLEKGAAVPRGSYIRSTTRVARPGNAPNRHSALRYVLVVNPKISGAEILPTTDTRYQQPAAAFVLREDKTRGVLWHHEQTSYSFADSCVLHAELAGEFLIPPANVELMYDSDTYGHSGTFQIEVEDDPLEQSVSSE